MMKVYENIKRYAEACVRNEIVSCKKHIWACQRFLRDAELFETNQDFPFYWSEDSAQNIIDWFALLRHSKGILAGEPIVSSSEYASYTDGNGKKTGEGGSESRLRR